MAKRPRKASAVEWPIPSSAKPIAIVPIAQAGDHLPSETTTR